MKKKLLYIYLFLIKLFICKLLGKLTKEEIQTAANIAEFFFVCFTVFFEIKNIMGINGSDIDTDTETKAYNRNK